MKTCILAIQRYENINDIIEWVNYHISLGFNHIFLMDNNEEKDALKIDNKNLTIIPYYGQRNNGTDWNWQREAYMFGLNYIRSLNEEYDWLSIIDIDEFITFYNYANINEFIQKECIEKKLDSIQLLWELYNDDNKLVHKKEYEGNVLNTYKCSLPIDINRINDPWNFCYMRGYTKFIGKIKDELIFTESAHHPDKVLYENGIYKWEVCDPKIGVLRHYKYKSLEDFISLKCKQRNYVTSVHGSTWKYARTYFEDNEITSDKVFHFVMFEYKYKLNMEQWDIEYLQDALKYACQNDKWVFDIQLGNPNYSKPKNEYNNVIIFYFNESNLCLDICPYVKFMYEHKLYDFCIYFFRCLLLYYFGGIYHNNIIKPFNTIFKDFIDYCDSFIYEQLEEMYNN